MDTEVQIPTLYPRSLKTRAIDCVGSPLAFKPRVPLFVFSPEAKQVPAAEESVIELDALKVEAEP